jgi:DNA primase
MYPTDPTPIQNSIILVEGMFDMLNVWDKGLKNVVCCYGTSMGNVKGERKKKEIRDKFTSFKMQGITSIYIMFDPDPPGRGAAQGLKDNLKDMFFVETIDLSEEQGDPGDLSYSDVQELKKVLYG